MDNKKFEEYLSQRYTDQINWYSYRASVNKQWYQVFQWGVIILSALIPVIVALDLKT